MTHLYATSATVLAVFTYTVSPITLTPPTNLNLGELSESLHIFLRFIVTQG